MENETIQQAPQQLHKEEATKVTPERENVEPTYNDEEQTPRQLQTANELPSKEVSEDTLQEEKLEQIPHQLITKEVLENTLQRDLGPCWKLEDFKIKDFTKKGDNYACVVTGIMCNASLNGSYKKVYYVAKLNPLRLMTTWDTMTNDIFVREGKFLTDVAKELNQILIDIDYPKINFPECIYCMLELRKEVLMMKDLRQKGFKMFDRMIGMDYNHSLLLVKELAKLHGSSYIYKKSLKNVNMLDLYPFMYDSWLDDKSADAFKPFLTMNIETSIKLTPKNYSYQKEWLRQLKDVVYEKFRLMIMDCKEEMKVICHGDCWNNNVLFRYDEDGNPLEITLIDLQLCRYASAALDLNYFFYTSLTGEIRRKYQDDLVAAYYEEFENVTKAAATQMPFSFEEFRQEVHNKALFGIISGLMILPLIICESKDVPDFNDISEGEFNAKMQDYYDSVVENVSKMPIFNSRFLGLLDDIVNRNIKLNRI